MVNITLALRTTRFLEKEHEYMPWQAARDNLGYIFLMFGRSEVFGSIQVGQRSHPSKDSGSVYFRELVPF